MADISKIERKGILYNIKDATARNLLQQKYTVPIGGIPKEDLSLEVQNLLQAAKTAIQNYTETDPTVPAWAKAVNKPTYTAEEVGALPSTTHIPVDPVNADWNASSGLALILNKPALFSGDYNDLINKPVIPSGYDDTVLSGRITTLENAGFITLESDPTVPSWAKASTKPSYTANEVGALPADTVIPVIPTNVSSFVNDAGYLTQHLDISGKANISDLATVATSGSYNDLSDTPDVPIAISVNEQSFVMNQFHAFVIPDYYTKTQIDNAGYVTSSDVADAVADLVDSAPSTLDTLNELAAALGDDPNFATTIANQIGLKANVSDVYTKSEIDNAGYLTLHQSLSDYYTKSQVDNLTEKTLTRGDGKLLYNGLTIDTTIANVGISSSNNLLNNGFNMAIRSNSSNPFFGLKEGNNLWYALAASNYFYFGPTSAKALRLDQDGNGVFQTGSVTANSFIKKNGTSSLFLKADGSVDSNVYITSHLDISGKANTSDLAEVATSGSYNDLTDKPTIPSAYNDTALSNRVTALENAGFLTSETDPNVPAWAKAATKPSYTASEVGALPDTTVIPTATSQLTNDSGFLTTHQDISGKQDALTAGDGIAIDANDTIRTTGIPFGIVDSTSTSTAYTVTVPGIYKLEDGVCCLVKNGKVTSESGFTLNVNGLGAKPSYNNMATGNPVTPTNPTRDTTIFNINYTMLFIYSSTLVDGGAWICYRGYDANTNTIGYQVRSNSMSLPATDKFYRYRLLFTSADGSHYVPANTSSSTNATASRTVNQTPIDPFGHIVYYGYTTAIDTNARPGTSYLWIIYTLSLGYSFNRTGAALTLTSWAPVYIKCAPQANGSAIIDENTPYVQALPTTADGKIYIFLGVAYNATSIELLNNHPVYYHDGTGIRIWTGKTIPSKTSELTNDSNFVQSTSLATVATSGSYNDLTNKPTIPAAITVDSTITQNGTNPVQGGAIYSALEGKEDKTFVININYSNSTYSADKTPLEIYEAYMSGKTLVVKRGSNTYALCVFSGGFSDDLNGEIEAVFYGIDIITQYILGFYLYAYCEDGVSDITWELYNNQYVPTTRKINNKPLSTDITLTASDVGALPSTTTIPTVPTNVSSFTNDAGYLTSHLDISGKADVVTIVTNSSTGSVSLALDPNKFYKFTGALTALTLTLNAGTGLCIYAGKFTSDSGTACTVTIPNDVKLADNAPSVEAGGTYEFSIADNLMLLVKEGS